MSRFGLVVLAALLVGVLVRQGRGPGLLGDGWLSRVPGPRIDLDLLFTADPDRRELLDRAREILATRLEDFGVADSAISLEGGNRLRVRARDVPEAVADRIRSLARDQQILSLHVVLGETENVLSMRPTPEQLVLPGVRPGERGRRPGWYLLRKDPALDGTSLAEASVKTDRMSGFPKISLRFHPEFHRRLAEVTGALEGQRLAIVLGGEVLVAPVIRGKINGGEAEIMGDFDEGETRRLLRAVEAGALPVRLTLVGDHSPR